MRMLHPDELLHISAGQSPVGKVNVEIIDAMSVGGLIGCAIFGALGGYFQRLRGCTVFSVYGCVVGAIGGYMVGSTIFSEI